MKLLITAILLMVHFTSVSYASNSETNTKLFVFVEAKIYRLNDYSVDRDIESQLKNAVLEESPALMTIAGKKATIQIGEEYETGSVIKMLTLHIIPNDDATKYDLDFQVQDGENMSISHIEGATIDNILTLSTSLNNVTRLITVKTTKLNEDELAKAKQ